MGSKPTPPAPPDPVKTSQAQATSNVDTATASARLAAVNQNSPYGNVTYDTVGNQKIGGNDVPQYQQTISFSPEQQGLYNSTTGLEQQALNTASNAFGNAQGAFSSPFSLGNAPALRTNLGAPSLSADYYAAQPNFGIANSGNIQSQVGNAGGVQNGLQATGQDTQFGIPGNIQASFSNPRSIADAQQPTGAQTSLGNAGSIAGAANPTGQQVGVGYSGPIQGQLDRSNLPSLPGVNDFSAERQKVEDAYLGRFNTDIANQQNNTESRLNAQGLQQGSEGWNQAQDSLNRERVDARNAAIQAGGAEQSRLFGLASQARGQLFGENQAAGNFANSAQSQAFGQNLSGGQFTNQALNDLYNQSASSVNQANAGQQQQFGQNLAGGQFANQGLAQQYAQGSSSVDQANNAQNQAYLQSLGQGQFANQAQSQQYSQAADQARFANDARQNQFGQNLASQNANNSAQAQLYAQLLGSGNFANQAQAQQFGQNQAAGNFYNQAAAQQNQDSLNRTNLYNSTQQQQFGNQAQDATLQNQARQQSISEAQLLRSQPINELATLLGLGSNVQTPTGAPNFGVNVAPTNVLGAYGMQQQGQQAAYQAQLQNSPWNALAGLLGTGAGGWASGGFKV